MKYSQCTQQFLDDDGNPLNMGKVYYYEPDGAYSTEKTVYKDKAGDTVWMQPIVLGADGRPVGAPIFEDGDYDRKVFDSADNLIREERNVGDTWSAVSTDLSENPVSNHSFDVAGSGSQPIANWTAVGVTAQITRDTSDATHGVASAKFTLTANDEAELQSDFFPVNPKKDLILDFMVKSSNASAAPKIEVAWFTGAQTAISDSIIYHDNVGLTPTVWTHKQGYRITPPSTALYAKLNLFGNSGGTDYTTNFDDIQVEMVPQILNVAPFAPYGLILSRDTGDTAHDIKITSGAVKSNDFADDIILTQDLVKRADATWAVGTGNGGAASGWSLPNEGMFYVHLIKNSGTGQVDALFDDSSTAPTLPTGYDVFRLIGALHTNSSSNVVAFLHKGHSFFFDQKMEDVTNTAVPDNTSVTGTFSVPPNCVGHFTAYWLYGAGDSGRLRFIMMPKGFSAQTYRHQWEMTDNAITIQEFDLRAKVLVNADSQADYQVTDSTGGTHTGTLILGVVGFDMLTRDNP